MYKPTRREAIGLGILGIVGAAGIAYLGQDHIFGEEPLARSRPRQQVGRLTQDNLTEIIEASEDTPTIIKLTAKWCGPCKALKPIYEGAASEYRPENMRFLDYDIDKDLNVKGTALEGSINKSSIPNVIVLYKGKVVRSFDGNELAEGKYALLSEAAKQEVKSGKAVSILTGPGQVAWKHYLMRQLERTIR